MPQGRRPGNPQRFENSRGAPARVNSPSVQRRWLGLLGVVLGVAACGTDAVGVSECRAIERARCDAAVACGYPNAEECRRLQRDQCLHGVAAASVSSVEADACVRDIERAGECAATAGPATAASACMPAIATDAATRSACDVVLSPERTPSCAFLAPSAPAAPAPAPAAPARDGGA
jgi:hypothetical protein